MKFKKYFLTALALLIAFAIVDAINNPQDFIDGWNLVSMPLGHFIK